MPPYSFPILGTKDIVNGLANLGIGSVTPEQLLKINSETAAHIYECFIQNIVTDGSSKDETVQPIFCGLEVLEDQELHRDSVGIINTFSKIKKVMKAAGAHDFSSKDIFKPDPQRTLKFLSALINFSCYREEKLSVISSALAESDQEVDKQIILENRKLELEHELTEIEAERRSKLKCSWPTLAKSCTSSRRTFSHTPNSSQYALFSSLPYAHRVCDMTV